MTQTKPTPGPWETREVGNMIAVAQVGYMPHATVFNRGGLRGDALTDTDRANARVIANASVMHAHIMQAIATWPEFDATTLEVDGGDMVDWFVIWRETAKKLMGIEGRDYPGIAHSAGYELKENCNSNIGFYCVELGGRDDSPKVHATEAAAWEACCRDNALLVD